MVTAEKADPPSKYPTWPEGTPLRFQVERAGCWDTTSPRPPLADPRLRQVSLMKTDTAWFELGTCTIPGAIPEGTILTFMEGTRFESRSQSHRFEREHHYWWIEIADPAAFYAFLVALDDQVSFIAFAEGNGAWLTENLAGLIYIGTEDC